MSNNLKRIVSYILALTMLFTSVFTNTIFADDDITDTTEITQDESDISTDTDSADVLDENADEADSNENIDSAEAEETTSDEITDSIENEEITSVESAENTDDSAEAEETTSVESDENSDDSAPQPEDEDASKIDSSIVDVEEVQAGTLPEDKVWSVNDAELKAKVEKINDKNQHRGTPMEEHEGLRGFGEWAINGGKLKYTHRGTEYEFASAFQGGLGTIGEFEDANDGSGDKIMKSGQINFYFTPKQACIVTVAYDATTAGRELYINQNGVNLAVGSLVAQNGVANSISADISDPSAGPVVIYGGGSNKRIYAIFVDYYDPDNLPQIKASGTVTYNGGNASELDNLKLVFSSTKNGETKTYDATFKENNSTYEASIDQLRNYDIYVADKTSGNKLSDYVVSSTTNSLEVGKEDVTHNIEIVKAGEKKVKGDIVVHKILKDTTPLDLSQVNLKFDDGANNVVTLSGSQIVNNSYTNLELRDSINYTISAENADGYELSPLSKSYSIAADDSNPFKNILFTEVLGNDIQFTDTLEVGADKQFTRIGDALKYVKAMKGRPDGEAGRITIKIDSGTYREQVVVDIPYITLKGAEETTVEQTAANRATANDKRPKITFYYGIGYKYSSVKGGYYDEDKAVQKSSEKAEVSDWGCTLAVKGKYFIGENIIFENSFNCEVVPEELADGIEKTGSYPDRTEAGFDARSKAATERAAAFKATSGSDYHEFYNCDFISSQDTFGTGTIEYVKDCYIEGGTDYICGGNSAVFENCILAWHGYTDKTEIGGYITACKSSGKPEPGEPNSAANGYLFENCTITNSKYYPDHTFAAGSWGRNWGGANCQAIFHNTTIDGAKTPGAWVEMGGPLNLSVLYVDVVKDASGNAIDTSGTTFNPNGTMQANGHTIMKIYKYFNDWVPSHYEGELAPLPFKVEANFMGTTPDFLKTDTDNNELIKGTAIAFAVDKDGNRVDSFEDFDTNENLIWKFEDFKYHDSQHGLNPGKITVKVPGTVKITYGGCKFSENSIVTLKKAGETTVLGEGNTTSVGCYDVDTTKNFVEMYYVGEEPAVLEISGGGYTPYVAIEEIKKEDIRYRINFNKGTDESVEGVAPSSDSKKINNPYTVPANTNLYKEGYTLTSWSDGENNYKSGDKITSSEYKVINLTPVFTPNAKSDTTLKGGLIGGSVTFDFQKNNGMPPVAWEGTNNPGGILVYQKDIGNGKKVDVKLTVDTTTGKFNNSGNSDWTQVNDNTKFTMEVVKGDIITFVSYENKGTLVANDKSSTEFADNASYTVPEGMDSLTLISKGLSYIRTITLTRTPTKYDVEFDKGTEEGVIGEIPVTGLNSVTLNENTNIPVNRTLYKDGKTLTGWTDGTNTYNVGGTLTSADYKLITLTPVFEDNAPINGGSVVFNFKDETTPNVSWENAADKFIIYQRTDGTNSNDVKIGIDTSAGKFEVTDNTGAKVSDGTKFVIDVEEGDNVKFAATGDNAKLTVDGDTPVDITADGYTVPAGVTSVTLTASGITALESITVEKVAKTEYEVNFDISSVTGIEGDAPKSVSKPFGENTDIPVNRTLYKEGNTLIGWSDGENTYKAGDTITSADYKVFNLTPVFTDNEVLDPGTITFDFTSAPVVDWTDATGKFLVYQKTVDTKTIDVKINITAGSFKVEDNTGAKVSNDTKFAIPVSEGDIITFAATGDGASLIVDDTAITADGYTVPAGVTSVTLAAKDITAIQSITIKEKEKEIPKTEFTVNFDKGSGNDIKGDAPESITKLIDEEVTIPVNRTLYVDGKTLTGWSDGTKTYKAGDTVTSAESTTINLTPVFTANEAVEGGSVIFDFTNAPVINWEDAAGKFLVYQKTVDGKTIDVKIDITAGSFEIDGNNGAVVSDDTAFKVDVVKGDVIKFVASGNDASLSVNGAAITADGYTVPDGVTSVTLVAKNISSLKTITVTAGKKDDDPKPPTPQNFMYGDVDGNKRLNAIDAAMVLVMALDSSNNYDEDIIKIADVNGNGRADIDDASLILQKVLKSDTVFPVEKSQQ